MKPKILVFGILIVLAMILLFFIFSGPKRVTLIHEGRFPLRVYVALREASKQALAGGFQVCVHAIGDRANNIVLNVYEQVFKSEHVDGKDVRFRIEHAQILDPPDIPRFHRLGVIPMMQPIHCTSDMYWAEARLGPKRILGAYAEFEEAKKGSLEKGKLADLVVITSDIMKIPPEKILETAVTLTMVAGKIVYPSGRNEGNSGK